METSSEKSILIRHRDDDDEPNHDQQPTKIQRLESSSGETVPATKIIDLSADCLAKIFGHLDLKSLFNVAAANKRLQLAAGEAYKHKFGAMTVKITECHKVNCAGLHQRFKLVEVCGLKICLQFLRCFGLSISDLMIAYKKSESKRYQYVLQQMNNYCTEGLNRIRFWNMPNITIKQQPQKVFSNVKTVEFWFGDLGQQWPSIVECFPNVQNLKLVHSDHCKKANTIQKPLHHLKELRVDASNGIRPQKTVKNLMQMAQQLKRLEIHTTDNLEIPMSTLLDWIKLDLWISKMIVNQWGVEEAIEVHSEEVQQLIDNNPALIELVLSNYQFAVDDAIAVIRELGSLKKFHFQMKWSDYTYFVNQLGVVWEVEYHFTDDDSDDDSDDSEDGSYDSDDEIILVELKR